MFTITKAFSVLAIISAVSAAPTCKNRKGAAQKASASASASASESASSSYQASWESASASSTDSWAASSTSDATGAPNSAVQAAAIPTWSSSSAVSSGSSSWSAEPSSTWTESSSSAAPSPSATGGASTGEFHGQATYYAAGLGACGWTNSGSDFIVAVNQAQYSADNCGKNIVITNPTTGKTTTAQQADLCPSCAYGALDMSEGLFSFLNDGNMAAGIFQMEWNYAS